MLEHESENLELTVVGDPILKKMPSQPKTSLHSPTQLLPKLLDGFLRIKIPKASFTFHLANG